METPPVVAAVPTSVAVAPTESSPLGESSIPGKRLQRDKLEQQIAQLEETMHLPAEQKKSRLTTWLGGLTKKLESMDLSNPASLTRLSEIAGSLTNDIEFEGGQREEIYKILTQNAENSVLEKLKNPSTSEILTTNGGADRNPYDLRLPKPVEASVKNIPIPRNAG